MRVAGFGFRKDAPYEALRDALQKTEAAGGSATVFATIAAKATSPALKRLAAERGIAVLAVPVHGVDTPTRSARVQALHGTGSLCEAAALVAAGPDATLVVGRVTTPDGMATCAVAHGKGTSE